MNGRCGSPFERRIVDRIPDRIICKPLCWLIPWNESGMTGLTISILNGMQSSLTCIYLTRISPYFVLSQLW